MAIRKQLARDDVIEMDPTSGLISIMGGKWTTHRAMAEDTIHQVQQALGVPQTDSKTRNHVLVRRRGFHGRLLGRICAASTRFRKKPHVIWLANSELLPEEVLALGSGRCLVSCNRF